MVDQRNFAGNIAYDDLREWLARGSRAPSDAAWIADGIISSQWAPISPVTGKLDAFEWRQPDERLDYIEAMPQITEEIETKEAPPALSAPEPIGEPSGITAAQPASSRRRARIGSSLV